MNLISMYFKVFLYRMMIHPDIRKPLVEALGERFYFL